MKLTDAGAFKYTSAPTSDNSGVTDDADTLKACCKSCKF